MLSDVILYSCFTAGISAFLQSVIDDVGVFDAFPKKGIYETFVPGQHGFLCFAPDQRMGRDNKAVCLDASEFGSGEAGTALQFCKVDLGKIKTVSLLALYLV